MWKVIYVTSHKVQVARVVSALTEAGLLCQARHIGDVAAGTDEIMVIDQELEEAQAVLASVVARERGGR